MCFSATASFGASAILAGAGAASTKLATRKSRLFSLIPFLFAIQQGIEGLQWLALGRGEASLLLGYGFIFFAFLLWPVYMPLSFMQMETDEKRLRRMRPWLWVGSAVSLALLVGLVMYPLEISVMDHHIRYFIGIPYPMLISAIYTFAIAIPGIMSRYFYARLFAVLTFLFSVFSGIMYAEVYVSTWCFFAAILSFIIVFGVREQALAAQKK